MSDHLVYSGTRMSWHSGTTVAATYRATSGNSPDELPKGHFSPDHRLAKHQCLKDEGPIPAGTYYLEMTVRRAQPFARIGIADECALAPGTGIQRIPRGGAATAMPGGRGGAEAGRCEGNWANWGRNRVRLLPADARTASACGGRRGNFYLHDSNKGYTHGCIEVEAGFFTRLYTYAHRHRGEQLQLTVTYESASTYGGTDRH